MREKKFKNLVFDFGNVLVSLDRDRCIQNFKALGLNDIEHLVSDSFKEGLFKKLEQGLVTPEEFHYRVREMSGKEISDEQIDAAWNSFLGEIPSYKLDALLQLRENYMVYLLSNTNAIHWDWSCENLFAYNGFDVNSYFEKIYLSFEMKMMKPDIQIFHAMMDDATIEPSETLFIDDSIDNCFAAQSLGIYTYVAKPDEDWRKLFF